VVDRKPPKSAHAYTYQGRCPRSGQWLELPRTNDSETIARQLMVELGEDLPEGKMYGVLLGHQPDGKSVVLKAFSGLWHGQSNYPGWVPPIPGRQQVAVLEVETLATLNSIAHQLQAIQSSPLYQEYQDQLAASQQSRNQLNTTLQSNRQERQRQRTLHPELEQTLDRASRQDSSAKRRLKEYWQQILHPLEIGVAELKQQAESLRQQRRTLSRQLQNQMHSTATLTNFNGESLSLQALRPSGMPTGSGDCCAPKLLHYAASHGIEPISMAEFWWGPASGDKQPGQFYPACIDRCQPLMGFLLSGLSAHLRTTWLPSLTIIYEDEYLLAIDKPAGLLSVPGRYGQDHVIQRLQQQLSSDIIFYPVHRLDRDTSGLLLLAKDLNSYQKLAAAFASGGVQKIYHGVVAGKIDILSGTIDLPLIADLSDRPRQRVDWKQGKPSRTHFRVLSHSNRYSRLEFQPVTGRTHQLRVHALYGLGLPLLGDRLYSDDIISERLHLHAHHLLFSHPHFENEMVLRSATPF
jgi:tRNA pseudouridine32 synthase / 23S rRNA pseudouridine746 synthase